MKRSSSQWRNTLKSPSLNSAEAPKVYGRPFACPGAVCSLPSWSVRREMCELATNHCHLSAEQVLWMWHHNISDSHILLLNRHKSKKGQRSRETHPMAVWKKKKMWQSTCSDTEISPLIWSSPRLYCSSYSEFQGASSENTEGTLKWQADTVSWWTQRNKLAVSTY